jgi:hypothetical protein
MYYHIPGRPYMEERYYLETGAALDWKDWKIHLCWVIIPWYI